MLGKQYLLYYCFKLESNNKWLHLENNSGQSSVFLHCVTCKEKQNRKFEGFFKCLNSNKKKKINDFYEIWVSD